MTEENDDASNFVRINRRLWNEKVDYHIKSSMYDVDGFLNGKDSLNKIEKDLLENVEGKRILHLQCHFGLDSLSLIRHGAAQVTGVDFSDRAIDKARELTKKINREESTKFICCDLYELENHLSIESDQLFDIVFTSYGVVGWLPDLQRWSSIISRYLRPNGKFVIVEFHPILWMFDDRFTVIEQSYFNRKALIFHHEGTYADRDAPIKSQSVEWNHSLSDILQSLINSDLTIESIQEFDYSPYHCFLNSVRNDEGFYQIQGLQGKIPMIFALKATKRQSSH